MNRQAFHRSSLSRRVATFLACVCAALVVAFASTAEAAVPAAETLIPGTARTFVSIRSTKAFEEAVQKTKFGGIFKEESLKPFVEEVKAQLDSRIADAQSSLGLKLEDFKNLSDGEIAFTVVDLGIAAGQEFHGATGTAVIVDVSGHDKELAAVRGKITTALVQKNGVPSPFATADGATGTRYDIPAPKEGHPTVVMVEAAQTAASGAVWIVSDSPMLVAIISSAFAGKPLAPLAPNAPATLAEHEVFKKLMTQSKAAEGEPAPVVVGYADPFGLLGALRAYQYPVKKIKPDPLKVLSDAGLTGIQGIGGQAVVNAGNLGTILRVGVIMKKPYEKSMQMFTFPPGSEFVPQAWVRNDVVGYATLYWDTLAAFDNFGPIFDGFLEQEGIWKDVVDSLETDPDGPQINVRKEFFELLGKRLTLVLDKREPKTETDPPPSSQFVLAIEVKAGATPEETKALSDRLAESLKKAFANDKTVERAKINDLDVWKITQTEEVPAAAANQTGVKDGVREVFRAYVMVHNGHVLIGSDLDALGKVLHPAPAGGLSLAADYVAVTNVIGKYIPTEAKEPIAIGFNRSDKLLKIDYEQFKAGKMAGSQTLLGRIFDALWAQAEKDGRQFKPLDGSKLPPFEKVQKYLSPTGFVISNTADGIFLVGFVLEDAPPAPADTQAAAAAAPEAQPASGGAPNGTPPAAK